MLSRQDRVICGLSGGADSVFLLLCLKEYSEELGFPLRAVHVHHGIRGAEADRDAAFCAELCERLGVPLTVRRRKIPEEARAAGLSEEEAGRNARREIFEEEAHRWIAGEAENGSHAIVRVALAHHLDDLAESVLFRIARGSGIRGLAAMRPVSCLREKTGGPAILLIRPLLNVTRQEIEEELSEVNQPYCTDSTNAEDDAARNRIRHRILPELEDSVNSAASLHLAQIARAAAEADDFLRAEGRLRCPRYIKKETDGIALSGELPEKEMPAMQHELIRLSLEMLLPGVRDVGRIHERDLLALFAKEPGKQIDLPHGFRAVRRGDGIFLTVMRSKDGAAASGKNGRGRAEGGSVLKETEEEAALPPGGSAVWGTYRFFAEMEHSVPPDFPEKRYTKTIDYDKIISTLVIRKRRKGDFLTVRSDGARKSLSDFFTDAKVPREERDLIPVVADGSEIVWVVGMRLGYRYRISGDTHRALTLTAERTEAELPSDFCPGSLSSFVNGEKGEDYGHK